MRMAGIVTSLRLALWRGVVAGVRCGKIRLVKVVHCRRIVVFLRRIRRLDYGKSFCLDVFALLRSVHARILFNGEKRKEVLPFDFLHLYLLREARYGF